MNEHTRSSFWSEFSQSLHQTWVEGLREQLERTRLSEAFLAGGDVKTFIDPREPLQSLSGASNAISPGE